MYLSIFVSFAIAEHQQLFSYFISLWWEWFCTAVRLRIEFLVASHRASYGLNNSVVAWEIKFIAMDFMLLLRVGLTRQDISCWKRRAIPWDHVIHNSFHFAFVAALHIYNLKGNLLEIPIELQTISLRILSIATRIQMDDLPICFVFFFMFHQLFSCKYRVLIRIIIISRNFSICRRYICALNFNEGFRFHLHKIRLTFRGKSNYSFIELLHSRCYSWIQFKNKLCLVLRLFRRFAKFVQLVL